MCVNVTLCLFPCNKNNNLPTSLGHHIFFLTDQVSSSKGLGVLGKGASQSLGLVLKVCVAKWILLEVLCRVKLLGSDLGFSFRLVQYLNFPKLF